MKVHKLETTRLDLIETLGRRWDELTKHLNDAEAYRKAELADPPFGGDHWANGVFEQRDKIETQIFAIAEPTIAGIILKLRIAAYHMRMPGGGDIPSNPLDHNEKIIASALADAERLAGGAA
jgi:hypothetical protein